MRDSIKPTFSQKGDSDRDTVHISFNLAFPSYPAKIHSFHPYTAAP
jgi:hypothetical protein